MFWSEALGVVLFIAAYPIDEANVPIAMQLQ